MSKVKSRKFKKHNHLYLGIAVIVEMVHKKRTSFKTLASKKAATCTAQKLKFTIKDFSSKCDQIYRKLRILPHLLKKSLIVNFIFCAVIAFKKSQSNDRLLWKLFLPAITSNKKYLSKQVLPIIYTPEKRLFQAANFKDLWVVSFQTK